MDKYEDLILEFRDRTGYEVGEGILLAFALFLESKRQKETVAIEALDGELITASRAAEILGVSVSQIIEMRNKRVKDDDLTAAYMKGVEDGKELHEKETCECKEWKDAEQQIVNAFFLSTAHHGPEFQGPTFRLCPYCGRRVGEGKRCEQADSFDIHELRGVCDKYEKEGE